MSILVSEILVRVSTLLLDEEHTRWPVEELIRWINDTPGALLSRRPAAISRTTIHTLVQGTYQTIPDDGVLLLDVVRNMGTDGITPGRPVRRSDRQQIDDIDPDWHTGTAKDVIKQYTFDDRLPKSFYVYPPAIAGTKVELVDAALPATVADEGDTLAIGAEYIDPICNYVVYRAQSKDSEFANGAVAGAYYQAFEAALGVKSQADASASPNQPNNSV